MALPMQKPSQQNSQEGSALDLDLFGPYDSWHKKGACVNYTQNYPDYFFDRKTEFIATTICKNACPVRNNCLYYALANQIPYGVWGGETQDQRKGYSGAFIKKLRELFREAERRAKYPKPRGI